MISKYTITRLITEVQSGYIKSNDAVIIKDILERQLAHKALRNPKGGTICPDCGGRQSNFGTKRIESGWYCHRCGQLLRGIEK